MLMFDQLCYRENLRDLIVAINAHQKKSYHLGLGKHVTKSNLAKNHQNQVYRIFEDFAYFLVDEARRKRTMDISKLGGYVYAFDSTTIDLYLNDSTSIGVESRYHTLYDIETQIPTFFHITNAKNLTALQVANQNRWQVELFFKSSSSISRLRSSGGTTECTGSTEPRLFNFH